MVNIAVFAAFQFRVGDDLRSNAAFKPVCRQEERDIARSGWQKWQDRGKKWQRMARWAAKTARMRESMAVSTSLRQGLPSCEMTVFGAV
jgi:hypothetical protein